MAAIVSVDTVRQWIQVSLESLGAQRAAIDSLNVFPVPDGDTGTNMYMTLESTAEAIDEAAARSDATLSQVGAAMARGALLGARGNSGVILAQILRAFAEELRSIPDGAAFDGPLVRRALRRASDLAYHAVAAPVEGTILTVARAAADAAEASDGNGVVAVVEAGAAGARAALAQTTEMLPALRRAGVVDSGGAGLVVVYDAMMDVLTGIGRPHVPVRAAIAHETQEAYGGPAYEVMYLLDATEAGVDVLRSRLEALGDSLVVVGGDPLWNVHVHVDDAGAAVEAALEVGRPHRIRITHLQTLTPEPKGGRSLVVVATGPGVAAMLADGGAVVVPVEPTRRPSTREILHAIDRCEASEVIVLPSDRDTRAVAEAAAEEARAQGLRVAVIPTRSVVQSLAAVAVHEPSALFEDDVIAMTRAASATHYGAITIATREALTSVGECRAGDVLGLAEGDIVHIGNDSFVVAQAVIERMLTTGSELVTVVAGLDSAGLPEALETWLARVHPGIDMVVYDGGQPLWPLIIGVE